ncbi:NAD(P)H-hydrate dehydratase [Pontibacter qinzhouensis]|uniref:Bifunctional NAD(P)H-hydrate repair enzyme n=1 Tax=Pontibacter qinzhouensis TaxID=2603253 RepID=A0A5C8JJE0_9BACT|nr:NAD(P)H-hydrate dehydratase [Pontibacter qinzhouensis]TXK37166.1 NAD(P)H-hydrate dehydratase [Pontibacter qinzhouensis]
MKILTAAQTRAADSFTINQQGIASVDLMERAAKAFTCWFENKFRPDKAIFVFCGPGNNGGDGLAVARLLHARGYVVQVLIVGDTEKASADFRLNLKALPQEVKPVVVTEAVATPTVPADAVIVDALFGTGLNRPVTGLYAAIIANINESKACLVAIDIPSDLYTDSQTPAAGAVVKAAYTVSFELPKLAFLLPQHEELIGEWHVVPIGLDAGFIAATPTSYHLTCLNSAQQLLKPRSKFSHKGTFGHALLVCGSYGKMGAAVLAAQACLRSGVGLLTLRAPAAGYTVLQTAVPEAMTLADTNKKHLSSLPKELAPYTVIGVGPGIGQEKTTRAMVGQLLATASQPLVIDADAINLIAGSDKLKAMLPKGKVIFTPHPKEFERLAGKTANNYERLERLQEFCREFSCYLVLKGSHSAVGTPEGTIYFNSTGNAGMATGGTGDVLTGIITALVAQQYSLEAACRLGVYVHGLAGDLAKAEVGEIAMVASDLIRYLPQAFQKLLQV